MLAAHIKQGDFPSAVYVVAEADRIICANALGLAVRTPERIPATLATIYDLASLTKPLVTALLVARMIERGALGIDDTAAIHLPEFRRAHADRITVRELLTHTSGLPAWRPLYLKTAPDAASVLHYIASQARDYEPGTRVVYSDLGFITLGFLLERLTETSLAELAAREIFRPLDLSNTFFNPPHARRAGVAASESGNLYEEEMCRAGTHGASPAMMRHTKRREGVIWGEVHDGNCHYLGGASGHAGLFSTVTETARLAREFIPRTTRLLAPETCEMFRTDMTEGLDEARSFGWQLAATPGSTAGESLPPRAFGHTGFAGTSLWIDAESARIFVLLTNRTHDRALPFVNINAVRRRFHTLAVERLDAAVESSTNR